MNRAPTRSAKKRPARRAAPTALAADHGGRRPGPHAARRGRRQPPRPPHPRYRRPGHRVRQRRSAHRRASALSQPGSAGGQRPCGENTAKLFERLGIFTVRDLLYFFPRRYDDFSALKPISALTYGQIETVIGTIWRCRGQAQRATTWP